MLVLSRKKDERVMIGTDVEIKVLEIRGDKVRLGINAPSSVPIMRHEVVVRLRENSVGDSSGPEVPVV